MRRQEIRIDGERSNEKGKGREKDGKQGKKIGRKAATEELRGPLASKSNHEAKCTPMKGIEKNR